MAGAGMNGDGNIGDGCLIGIAISLALWVIILWSLRGAMLYEH
jgi:hypothetical protein